MSIPNPFVTVRDAPQTISWKHLMEKIEYSMELILPFKCIMVEIAPRGHRKSAYMSLCAIARDNQQLHVSNLVQDQMMIIDIPAKTWQTAWNCVNYNFRQEFGEEDNLKVTFIKKSKQDIKIVALERLKPSEEQLEFANKYYSSKEAEEELRRTVVRESEEL